MGDPEDARAKAIARIVVFGEAAELRHLRPDANLRLRRQCNNAAGADDKRSNPLLPTFSETADVRTNDVFRSAGYLSRRVDGYSLVFAAGFVCVVVDLPEDRSGGAVVGSLGTERDRGTWSFLGVRSFNRRRAFSGTLQSRSDSDVWFPKRELGIYVRRLQTRS